MKLGTHVSQLIGALVFGCFALRARARHRFDDTMDRIFVWAAYRSSPRRRNDGGPRR